MNKQPEITDATRETLINAFFQLAQKNNITQITVREIINLAGYSRATFYRYFKDVFALVEYAEDSFFEKTRAALAEHEASNGALMTGVFLKSSSSVSMKTLCVYLC